MRKLTGIVIGAGSRGRCYSDEMAKLPEKFEIVGVAEPVNAKRDYMKEKFNIPEENCFTDWKDILEREKFADFAIIATLDRMHLEPALKAISLKYNLLLEKPVCPEAEECVAIERAAKENGVKVVVCHVLRYTPIFRKIKEIIDSGKLGNIVSINHEECVGNTHQSHSFVRGNWGNSDESSAMLLQKSCHDLDILQWLIGKKCKKIQSFGTLSCFTEKNAPEGSTERCTDGCPHVDTCPYNTYELYLRNDTDFAEWFRSVVAQCPNPTDEQVMEGLKTSQYGKCVYKCNNNVVDHQTVNMLFEDDITVTFSMNCFNKGGRFMHIFGTKGEMRAAMDGESPMEIFDFETRETTQVDLVGKDGIAGGHGGGDTGIVNALYDYLTDSIEASEVSEIGISCQNHMLVFAAEKSRATNTVVDVEEFINSL